MPRENAYGTGTVLVRVPPDFTMLIYDDCGGGGGEADADADNADMVMVMVIL